MAETLLHSWDRPAPERAGRPSAFALLPEDFQALGAPGRPEHIFTQCQHPWSWVEGRPRLSREIREWMGSRLDSGLPEILERHASEDGSTKVVLGLSDGQRIEAVHMPREVRNPRVTLCISSQVGCAMGCAFCATGSMGIRRNLGAGEIVGQVLVLLKELGPEKPHQITLVFMGMGEPLHNLDHVHRAIEVLNHQRGLNISEKRITVSTSGLVSGIERLARLKPRPWLAISRNATTDEARSAIMPVNRAWNLEHLRRALEEWPLGPKERLTFEYVLMAGVNDTMEDADPRPPCRAPRRGPPPPNPTPRTGPPPSAFQEPEEVRLNAFVARLKARGCFVTVRKSRGKDVQGACGQLIRDESRRV